MGLHPLPYEISAGAHVNNLLILTTTTNLGKFISTIQHDRDHILQEEEYISFYFLFSGTWEIVQPHNYM